MAKVAEANDTMAMASVDRMAWESVAAGIDLSFRSKGMETRTPSTGKGGLDGEGGNSPDTIPQVWTGSRDVA